MHQFGGPGPSQTEKGLEKGAPEVPQGSLREAKTAKNKRKASVTHDPKRVMCYERAPRGSGDLRGVLLLSFLVTLLGSCVTVSP